MNILRKARHLGAGHRGTCGTSVAETWNLEVGFPSEDGNESKGLLLPRGNGLAWDLCLRPRDPGCLPDLGEILPWRPSCQQDCTEGVF